MTPVSLDPISLDTDVCAAFLDALGRQDFDRLSACFAPTLCAHLLTPSALAMTYEAAAAGNKFRQWFGDADVLAVTRSEVSAIGPAPGDAGECISLRYCLHLREHGVWYRCEQQAYCWVKHGLIGRLDLLCSGFRPAPGPAA